MAEEEFISIGKILNFHGIQGEAKVGYSKGKDKQIASLKEVWISNKKFDIEKLRFHKQFAIIKFSNINSINDLLEFKGHNIFIPKFDAQKFMAENEYLIEDLIGLNVFDDDDDLLGTIKSVGTNNGNDILCVVNEKMGREILIPFVSELVPIVDIEKNKIVIKPIEGLIEHEI